MKKPTVDIELDPQGDRFLAITCPDCEHTNRYAFETLGPGIRLECACGVGFNISQQNIDDLKSNYGLQESS